MIAKEVLIYDHNIIDDNYISNLCSNNQVSSIGNEDDVVLEPCAVGERVCITQPKGVPDEYFYFYSGVIEEFTDFESDLLKTQNVPLVSYTQMVEALSKLLNSFARWCI